MPQYSLYGTFGNFPDSEKTQYMIYAVRIEIFCHFTKTGFPPSITVFSHLIPIICRESPILAFYREIIRWSSSLRIHVKQFGMRPRIHTIPTYPDRNIAFKHYAFCMRIIPDFKKLYMQMILNKIIKTDFIIINIPTCTEFGYIIRVENRIHLPFPKVRSFINITQTAISSIRLKPFSVSLKELFKTR